MKTVLLKPMNNLFIKWYNCGYYDEEHEGTALLNLLLWINHEINKINPYRSQFELKDNKGNILFTSS